MCFKKFGCHNAFIIFFSFWSLFKFGCSQSYQSYSLFFSRHVLLEKVTLKRLWGLMLVVVVFCLWFCFVLFYFLSVLARLRFICLLCWRVIETHWYWAEYWREREWYLCAQADESFKGKQWFSDADVETLWRSPFFPGFLELLENQSIFTGSQSLLILKHLGKRHDNKHISSFSLSLENQYGRETDVLKAWHKKKTVSL